MLTVAGLRTAAGMWTDDPTDPLAAPIHDSLAGLPPLFIYQGGNEVFLPDVKVLAAKAEAAGTTVHLWIEPKAFHVWVAISGTPEAKAALDDVAAHMKIAN